MYPDRRVQLQRRAALSRRLLATQRAHALYGLESDDLESLGGWLTRLKRKTGNVASTAVRSTVSVGRVVGSGTGSVLRSVRNADIPGFSHMARVGLAASDVIDSGVKHIGAQTASSPTSLQTFEPGAEKKWILPGLAVLVGAFFLFKR